MAGQQVLALFIEIRDLAPQPSYGVNNPQQREKKTASLLLMLIFGIKTGAKKHADIPAGVSFYRLP